MRSGAAAGIAQKVRGCSSAHPFSTLVGETRLVQRLHDLMLEGKGHDHSPQAIQTLSYPG